MRKIFDDKVDDLKLIAFFCTLLWIVSWSPFALAQESLQPRNNTPAGKNKPDKIFSVGTSDGTTVVGPGIGLWNFGDIDPLTYNDASDYTLEHEFTFINTNNTAVVIRAISGSDPRVRCEVLFHQASLPVTVPANDFIVIHLYYRLLPLRPGKLNVTVRVFIKDQLHPAGIYQCIGTVKDVVTFDPPVLNFG